MPLYAGVLEYRHSVCYWPGNCIVKYKRKMINREELEKQQKGNRLRHQCIQLLPYQQQNQP
jgi:hypothetical protein